MANDGVGTGDGMSGKEAMVHEQVRYEVTEGIATLTLDRPDKLNVYSVRMMEEMIDAFDRADGDDAVRAVIVTGAGRAFCAGADLESGAKVFDAAGTPGSPIRSDGTIDYATDSARDFGGLLTLRIFECLKPVIAAVNGFAAESTVRSETSWGTCTALTSVQFRGQKINNLNKCGILFVVFCLMLL